MTASSPSELQAALDALGPGALMAHTTGAPRVALLFSGQGSQYAGMAQGLAEVSPRVYEALREASEVLGELLDRPLHDLLADDDALRDTAVTQPVLLALEVGLARQWLDWGVQPVALLGHSLGELAAAVVAEVFSLSDGLWLAARRGALMAACEPGGMAAVRASEAQLAPLLAEADGVEVAATNHAGETVVAGPSAAVDAFVASLSALGEPLEAKRLAVSHAFHSAMIEPMLDPWTEAVASVPRSEPQRRMISLLTGREEQVAYTQASFWRRHAREAVRAHDALRALGELGVDLVLDVGPHPTLVGMAGHVLPQVPGVGSLRRGRSPQRELLDAATRLFEAGVPLRDIGPPAGRAELPRYPFDHRRFWLEEAAAPTTDWVYGVVWEPLQAPEAALPSRVHVLGDDQSELARALHAHGVAVVPLADGVEADAEWLIDGRPLHPTDDLERRILDTVAAVTRPGTARRIVVTRGGTDTGGDPDARAGIDPVASGVGALVRSLQVECRDQAPVWLDLSDDAAPDDVVRALRSIHAEDQLRVGAQGVSVPRLARRRVADRSGTVSGTWLITGGLGSLGLAVGRWLAANGVDKLVLTARRPLPDRSLWDEVADPVAAQRVAAVRELEAAGVVVVAAAVDVADREAMHALVRAHVPDGVVHAAGVTLPQGVPSIDAETVHRTVHAKVEGARVLDELTRELTLQGFVLFSSIAAVWGSVDLAAYSAANGFLDGLALQRRASSLPATSIAWGPWAGGGMVDAERGARLERAGQHLLPPDRAPGVMGALLRSPHAHAVVARVDWPRFLAAMEAAGPRPMLSTFRPLASDADAAVPKATPVPVVRSWTEDTLTDEITTQARRVLRLAHDRPLAPVTPLMELGFDSLMATELKRALDQLGIDVPLGRLLGGPSVEEIVQMAAARQASMPAVVRDGAEVTAGSDDDDQAFPMHLVWSHGAAIIVGIALAAAVFALL